MQARRRSPLANPRLLLPVAVILLVLGYYGYQAWQRSADRAAARTQLLTDLQAALQAPEPDGNALSQLMAGLKKLPDHTTSPELLAAQAEIELLRDRPERAESLFATIASQPGATSAQQRLGARILIRRQAGFTGEASAAEAMLQRVVALSETVYRDGGDAGDLLRAWQASKRLGAHERANGFAEQLTTAHADSPAAQLVQLAASFDPASNGAQAEDLELEFRRVPPELAAMLALVQLQRSDVPEAVAAIDTLLLQTPSVPVARYAGAIIYHACALASAAGTVDRERWLGRRDQQLDWLEQRMPADEPLRQRWASMRAQR